MKSLRPFKHSHFNFEKVLRAIEMEHNRDAANQCLQKAKQALKIGDIEKAKRMAEKSHRMFPRTETEKLLEVSQYVAVHSP